MASQDDPNHASESAVEAAKLRYVTDERPGYSRRRRGKGFSYHSPEGETVSDQRVKTRIEALAIPPAWQNVWISRVPNGHIQATGRDEAGRKQYIYHQRWTEVRDAVKFSSLASFGHALPALRRRINRDLKRIGLTSTKLTAGAVKLLDLTLIRVGNDSYAKANKSYGLTTLRDKHVRFADDEIEIRFQGKGGEKHAINLVNEELAKLIHQCQELPGYELFRFRGEDGKMHSIDSEDVNDYLRDATGQDVTAKGFRTWGGTVITAEALSATQVAPDASERELKRAVTAAVEQAANALGNTPAICRQSYVHPRILTSFLAAEFEMPYHEAMVAARKKKPRELRLHEAATLAFLEGSG